MRLPPLNALRAFEATARLGSVKAAAAELFVTPAAVSQQLRVLEDHLGEPLFERRPRALVATPRAVAFHQVVNRSLRAIAEAADRLRTAQQAVAISVVPSFAALWLAPRVAAFTRQHPRIEIRIDADPVLVDFRTTRYDLAIREGWGRYRDAESTILIPIEWQPVASPAYVASLSSDGSFDWQRARLLHEDDSLRWDAWTHARGLRLGIGQAAYYSHGMLAYAAAGAGEGVALAPPCLVERLVDDGRLAVVDPFTLPSDAGYWLAWASPAERPLSDAARLFRDWLIDASAPHRAPRAVAAPVADSRH